jgi:hypothetical protein
MKINLPELKDREKVEIEYDSEGRPKSIKKTVDEDGCCGVFAIVIFIAGLLSLGKYFFGS